MRQLQQVAPFALFVTLECLERRGLLLKDTKASLTPEEAIAVLRRAREAGHDTGVMIVIGLDAMERVTAWLAEAIEHLTDFPNLQIFQSHGMYMDVFRAARAEHLVFFLDARRRLEDLLGRTALRPQRWQNYRPLWYHVFSAEELAASGA